MIRVAHLTCVHPRVDTRIFHKMCCSLVDHGVDVKLIIADGMGNQAHTGVDIIDVGASKNRLDRIINAPARVFKKAVEVDADLYHLHDPELIPIGLKLKNRGNRVVFDSHEDVPRQILNKPYLSPPVRWSISYALRLYEAWACRQLDGVIGATPFIRQKFLKINPNTVDINNFPISSEIGAERAWDSKKAEVCYVGGISRIRGIEQMVQAFGQVQNGIRLNLCGSFSEPNLERACTALPAWGAIIQHGFLNRAGVRRVMGRSIAGLVTLHPTPNHIDSQPVKMFEYMSAGIPVIASDFPLWREIVLGNQCGLCVDPMDSVAIANAINYLAQHPREARQMGENGLRAVRERYNWPREENKLLAFYNRILQV